MWSRSEKAFARKAFDAALGRDLQEVIFNPLAWWVNYVDAIINESKVIVGNFGGVA
jgi:hypothetical protein